MHDSVTIPMDASPEEVWSLVSDVTRIGSYSPETFEAKWVEGATGPAVARFRGHVKPTDGSHVLDDVHRDRVRAGKDLRVRGRSAGQDAAQRLALRHRRRGRRL